MQFKTYLSSKIHGAVVTDKQIDYDGSCGIPVNLMETVGIEVHQQIDVYNINNGKRFTTYAIDTESLGVTLYGASARLGEIGDKLIIVAYAMHLQAQMENLEKVSPRVVYLSNHENETRDTS